MLRKPLIAGLFCAALIAIGQAEDEPRLPEGPPPRLVSVVKVKGDVLSYRDFAFTPPIPKTPGPFNPKELVPAHPPAGPMFACSVEFSLKEGTVLDAEGNKLDAGAAKKRLVVGATALVSPSMKMVDPAYLRILKKDTLILVHPPAPPGPPLPGGDQ